MSPRILYVDDEADLVELASSFFEDSEIPIDTSTDFQHALNLIRKNNYDIIISDVNMPTGSGHELYATIKKENIFHGKFVLVTGNAPGNEDTSEYELVILKPINFMDLVDEIKKILYANSSSIGQ